MVTPVLNRRGFLKLSAAAGGAWLAGCQAGDTVTGAGPRAYELTAAPKDFSLLENGSATAGLGYSGNAALPVLRVRQGQPVRIRVNNRLGEGTTVHWHGIRLKNPMDGVPVLTQPPIPDGDSFVYEFTPPDAGTFWFHPHANSVQQVGRGLAGALIVEEAEPVAFDADIPLVIKDWVIDEVSGDFGKLTTPRGAARAGTFGNIRTVNGQQTPHYDVPAGGWVRLRLVNVDATRIYKVMMKGDPEAEARIIAVDGNPLAHSRPLGREAVGPGMRLDLAVRVPERPGARFRLINTSVADPWDMVTFAARPADPPVLRDAPKLPLNPIPKPDLADAPVIPFRFDTGFGEGYILCGGDPDRVYKQFWTINGESLPGKAVLMPPLATLKKGRSYIFEISNDTPHSHPIHLHGFTFTVLSSNKYDVEPYHTDTVLLTPKERVRFAFVADNPGNWMYHCHILEHQETGMMGHIRVV